MVLGKVQGNVRSTVAQRAARSTCDSCFQRVTTIVMDTAEILANLPTSFTNYATTSMSQPCSLLFSVL